MTANSFFFSVPMLAVLGVCIGSFVNVVVCRLPRMMGQARIAAATAPLGSATPPSCATARHGSESLSRPSACPNCGARIGWLQLMPGLGWFVAMGRCAGCGVEISPRYPIVEFAVAAVFGVAAWRVGPHPIALAWAGFGAAQVTLALIEADAIMLPLLWAGLLFAAFGATHVTARDAVLGATCGYSLLWLASKVTLAADENEIGADEMKLLAVGGAWLGWEPLIAIVLAAAAAALCLDAAQRVRGGSGGLPFGSVLALAITVIAGWRLEG